MKATEGQIMSAIPIKRMPVLVSDQTQESFDVQELASEAADALEAYQRAPWRQLSDRVRMEKLRRAIALLKRLEGLESGRIPMPIWGD